MMLPCLVCEKMCYRSPKHLARTKSGWVFCGHAHRAEYMSGTNHHRFSSIESNCEKCGKVLIVSKGRIGTNRFCSYKCRGEVLRGESHHRWAERTTIPCAFCAKGIEVRPGDVKDKEPCCSRTCADSLHSARMKGKGNSNWLHGKANNKYPKAAITMRPKIRKRDKFKCQLCGIAQKAHLKSQGEKLSVHHIDYDRSNNKKDNLITLCKSCHAKQHGSVPCRLRWARKLSSLLSERCGYPERSITLKYLERIISSLKES